MPTPTDIARRRLAAASDDRARFVAGLALALLELRDSRPAASPLPLQLLSGVSGGGGEAGGSDYPVRDLSSFHSPAGHATGRVKETLERV